MRPDAQIRHSKRAGSAARSLPPYAFSLAAPPCRFPAACRPARLSRRVPPAAARGRRTAYRYKFLISFTSATTDFLASPKSIIVFSR